MDIGRAPGVVHVTFQAPVAMLKKKGLYSYAAELYSKDILVV